MLKTNIIIISIIVFAIYFFSVEVNGNERNKICLKTSYDIYKENFMSQDGRIIDFDRNNITTSEGQSYMLLRSLLMDDQKTFELVWGWTKNNLQREDKLFAWLWGKNPSGQYQILDENSAADGDVDTAFALLLAHKKWNNYCYLEEALPIIQSIWNKETRQIGDNLVLMPGVNQATDSKTEINPSYFAPYAFRLFQKYDEIHDWDLLVDSSYYYLSEIGKKTQTHLPTNWFLIENGQIVLEDSPKSDFSYDAIRVFARVYLDYCQTKDKRALPILKQSEFFVNKWKKDKILYTNYQANGQLRDKNKFIGSMAILIPTINIYDKKTAAEMYKSQIVQSFESEAYWSSENDYYGKNLSWFAYYLYNKNPINCTNPKQKREKS